ncbi:MAG: YIP1 family protein [Thermoanaerobaculia bacterium]
MSAPEPGASAPPRDSALARIPGVFFSPVRTLDSIAQRPTWVAPLVLWTICSVILTVLIMPRIDYAGMLRERMEEGGQQISEERLESMVETQSRIGRGIGFVWGTVAPTAISLLLAAIFLGAFKAFGWDLRFRQALGVTAHSFLPAVLGSLLAIPVISQREKIDPRGMSDLVRSNLGFLVARDASPALHSLLSSIDIFSLWVLALLVIGFAAASRVSRGRAAGIIVPFWVLFVLIKTGWVAMTG